METCQTCGQQFEAQLMYSHRLECKQQLPDPNLPSIQESNIVIPNRNGIRFIQQSQIQQSQIPRPQNYLPTDSLIRSLQTKCDYCQLEFPNEIMQEHLEACDEKKSIEQLQFNLYTNGVSFIQPQHSNQQQIQDHDNQNENLYNEFDFGDDDHDDHDNQNYQAVTVQRLGPQGRVTTEIQRRPQDVEDNFGNLMDQLLRNPNFSNQFVRNRQHHPLQFLSFLKMMGKQGMQEKEIENLNSIKYVPSANLSDEHKKCSICITEYEEGEVLILLPCTHRYHSECIGNWLKNSQVCPICKNDLRGD